MVLRTQGHNGDEGWLARSTVSTWPTWSWVRQQVCPRLTTVLSRGPRNEVTSISFILMEANKIWTGFVGRWLPPREESMANGQWPMASIMAERDQSRSREAEQLRVEKPSYATNYIGLVVTTPKEQSLSQRLKSRVMSCHFSLIRIIIVAFSVCATNSTSTEL